MSRARRFWQLAPARRALLLRALLATGAVRLGLWVAPFPSVRRAAHAWSRRLLRRTTDGSARTTAADVGWAVAVAASVVPRATCLTRSLAAQILLAREGHPSQLHLGVAKDAAEGFAAHAWLESGDLVVSDGAGRERYTPIATFEVGP